MKDLDEIKQFLMHLHKGMVDVFKAMEALNECNKSFLQQLKDVHMQILRDTNRIQYQLQEIQQNQVQKHDDVTLN